MKLLNLIFVVLPLCFAFFMVMAKSYRSSFDVSKKRKFLTLSFATALLILSDFLIGGNISLRINFDLMLSMIPLQLQLVSLGKRSVIRRMTVVIVVFQCISAVYYLMSTVCHIPSFADGIWLSIIAFLSLLQISIFILNVGHWLGDVHSVMKSGSVWTVVSLSVDVVYLMVPVACNLILMMSYCLMEPVYNNIYFLSAVLMTGCLIALVRRFAKDSAFSLWESQERKIAESMKVSPVNTAREDSRNDLVYKEIYDRLVEYFDREKPFLDGELTINDIVKVIYTNKVYLSKSINLFTGRNFCQFVNHYRVMHSIAVFRKNPELKVHELSALSGFNSIVSFNMAFRLFIGENPSEWCRKEKANLSRSLLKTKGK